MREYLKDVSVYCQGDYRKMVTILNKQQEVPSAQIQGNYICLGDAEYPDCFYELEEPPLVIYYQGHIELLKSACVGIVGSRKPSPYSLTMTQTLVEKIRQQVTIVSGLAYGIDICAHRQALDFSSIAVLGCGIDRCYPEMHRSVYDIMVKHHLVISEYPWGARPQRHYFPFRNRLIAALSSTLYVMSARKQSGTLHTVDYALKLNRHIVCLPHALDDPSGEGCNLLIQDGASMLTNMNDLDNIIYDKGW